MKFLILFSLTITLLFSQKIELEILGSGGPELETLEAAVLTHLHIDHSVDLPAFVKAGFFSERVENLDIIGPNGNEYFPSTSEYLQTLFSKRGAYR